MDMQWIDGWMNMVKNNNVKTCLWVYNAGNEIGM